MDVHIVYNIISGRQKVSSRALCTIWYNQKINNSKMNNFGGYFQNKTLFLKKQGNAYAKGFDNSLNRS